MSVAHPWFLLAAIGVALVFVRPAFRYFFRNWDQLVEDANLSSSEDRKIAVVFYVLGGCFTSAHFQINLLGFLLTLGTIVATIYHLLALVQQ